MPVTDPLEDLPIYRIDMVPPEQQIIYWKGVYAPLLAQALDHALLQSDDVNSLLTKLGATEAILLDITNQWERVGVAVIELPEFKAGKVLHVNCLAGQDMDGWLDELVEYCRSLAKQLDCVGVSCTGRPGWQRQLKHYGFELQAATLLLEV